MRPIIGLSTMHMSRPTGGTMVVAISNYLWAVEAAGGVPLLIPLSEDLDAVRVLFQLCDGILLPGGEDIDPAYFGEQPHPQLGSVDRVRDEVELALCRWAREQRKPLLGICRGIQVLNVAFGGTLYQDIPSQLPAAADHYASRREPGDESPERMAHAIVLEPGSWLAARLDAGELMVNTYHHQSVKEAAPGLHIVARSPDGVIEALEGDGDQFVVGVQCHPERLWDGADVRWQQLFRGFVEQCING